jgi:very-short-patch-repair endonuclease
MTEFFNRETEREKRKELRNSMPKAEVLLWLRLKGRHMLGCKFRRQSSVGAFVVDFYSPEIKLGIELDGDSHFQEGAREYDQERQAFIESFGIKIVRFLNLDIYENLDGVLEAIEREILDRRVMGASPTRPPLANSPSSEVAEP